MTFDSQTLLRMNEPTVREEIIGPIARKLGYMFGSTNYIEREEHLPDVIQQIGRKSKNDYPIGKPDYRCGVDGRRGSFIIEAKAGNIEITKTEIAQTHSYAAHGLINAKFFVICNGRTFQIYETSFGINSNPILELEYNLIEAEFYKIENFLSPDALIKHSQIQYETGRMLGLNLQNTEKVKFGWVNFSDCHFEIIGQPAGAYLNLLSSLGKRERFENDLRELLNRRQPIISGVVKRNQDGKIEAYLEFDSALDWISDNMAAMGINKLMFTTDSDILSNDGQNPTIFESISNSSLPIGIELRDGWTDELQRSGVPIEITMKFQAIGTLLDKSFAGDYQSYSLITLGTGANSIPLLCEYRGEFVLNIE
jgi:hypothetical protein